LSSVFTELESNFQVLTETPLRGVYLPRTWPSRLQNERRRKRRGSSRLFVVRCRLLELSVPLPATAQPGTPS